jgi:hypothetical protein
VPAFAASVVVAPAQIVAALGVIVASGWFTTFTVTVSVSTQPFALVPVTVYVVVTSGDATTVAALVVLKPAAGLQTYVVAPVAISVVLAPLQIVASLPAFTTGN